MTIENESPSAYITSTDMFVQKWERGSPFQTRYTLEEAVKHIIVKETDCVEGELEQIKERLDFIESVLVKLLAKEINTLGDLNGLATHASSYNQFAKLEE